MLRAISFAEWGTPFSWIFIRIKVTLRRPSTRGCQIPQAKFMERHLGSNFNEIDKRATVSPRTVWWTLSKYAVSLRSNIIWSKFGSCSFILCFAVVCKSVLAYRSFHPILPPFSAVAIGSTQHNACNSLECLKILALTFDLNYIFLKKVYSPFYRGFISFLYEIKYTFPPCHQPN